jgi:hypothetical protein
MPPSHGGSPGFKSPPVHQLRCVGVGFEVMRLRRFLLGLLVTGAGMGLLLLFSGGHGLPESDGGKWLGVGLMIGGPVVFWELLPPGKPRAKVE